MATLTGGIPKQGLALTFTAFFTLKRPLNLVHILCLSSLSNDKRKPKFKKIKIKKSPPPPIYFYTSNHRKTGVNVVALVSRS